MDVNDSLMRALKQTMEMFGISEEEVFEKEDNIDKTRIFQGRKNVENSSVVIPKATTDFEERNRNLSPKDK